MPAPAEILAKLCDYIERTCPGDRQTGDSSADVAIRWHQELLHLRATMAAITFRVTPKKTTDQHPGQTPIVQSTHSPVAYPCDQPPAPWEEAVAHCESLLDEIEELPSRAYDNGFAESVEEKVRSIMRWIEEHEHVTPAQWEALENISAGVARWSN